MQIGYARSRPGISVGLEQRLPGPHPVLVAHDRVDLAVVGDEPVRVGERPRRERVRREPRVDEHDGALDALVEEFGEEPAQLPGHEHALVDEGPGRERGEVDAARPRARCACGRRSSDGRGRSRSPRLRRPRTACGTRAWRPAPSGRSSSRRRGRPASRGPAGPRRSSPSRRAVAASAVATSLAAGRKAMPTAYEPSGREVEPATPRGGSGPAPEGGSRRRRRRSPRRPLLPGGRGCTASRARSRPAGGSGGRAGPPRSRRRRRRARSGGRTSPWGSGDHWRRPS